MGATPHKFGRTPEQNLPLGYDSLIDRGFLRDQLADQGLAGRLTVLAQYEREAVTIVIADEPAEIVSAGDLDLIRPQRRVKGLEMKLLGIGERTVEVEDDCPNRHQVRFARLVSITALMCQARRAGEYRVLLPSS